MTIKIDLDALLTGAYEGDGSVVSRYNIDRTGCRYFYPYVLWCSKEREILEWARSYLGLSYLYTDRSAWELRAHGQKQCRPLLDLFARYVVSEAFFLRLNDARSRTRLESHRWCNEYMSLVEHTHAPTMDWLVGFWYADGSVVVNHDFRASPPIRLQVFQDDREVLDKIARVFGGGVSPEKADRSYWSWSLYGKSAVELARYIIGSFPVITEKIARLHYYVDMIL